MAGIRGCVSQVVLVLSSFFALSDGVQGPQVTLPEGTLLTGVYVPYNESEFLHVDFMIEAYLGIPYAEPPVDNLRFKKPVKKDDLGQDYDATTDKASCPQGGDTVNPDEDCLHLGVYTASPRPSGGVPVMVWIHGGGFTMGAGSSEGYKPYPIIALSPDVIVVSINYRLGILGFLTTGDSSSPGNYGMFDQVMALQWVKDNIAAFGGDPNQITIMGESAGAASVGLHLVSPLSAGLFDGAIMESGNSLCPWAVDTNMERQVGFTRQIADLVNCTTTSSQGMVECLQDVSVTSLLLAQYKLVAENLFVELLFVPVIDNDFLPYAPAEIFQRQEFNRVPVLTGTNADEGTLIALRAYPTYLTSNEPPAMTLDEFRGFLPAYLYYPSPMVQTAVEQWYVDWTKADNSSADHLRSFIDLQTDQTFACANEAMARALDGAGSPVYRYEMTHVSSRSTWGKVPGWMAAGHGEDLQYVFGWALNQDLHPEYVAEQSSEEKRMAVQVMRYWTNFIKTGNPNGPLSIGEYPDWPRYTLPEQDYKIISLSMENDRALRMDSCAFWLNYAPKLYESEKGPADVYDEWQEDFEEWRDVYMAEWAQVFEDYKNNEGCPTP